jgi:hypothetical protein
MKDFGVAVLPGSNDVLSPLIFFRYSRKKFRKMGRKDQ